MELERRNSPRFRQYFEVRYVIRNVYGTDSTVTALTLDISATGMRLGTTRRLPKSQRFVECRITIGSEVVRVLVEIMWRTETSMGVRFINSPPLLKAEISRIQKRQRNFLPDPPPPPTPTPTPPSQPKPKQEPKKPKHPDLTLAKFLEADDLAPPPKQEEIQEPFKSTDLQKKWLDRSKPKRDLHRKWLDRRSYISQDDEDYY